MTKIYLDVCAIQRPLDTPNQVLVVLEAEAVLGILTLCDAGQIELISSEASIYEIEQNPFTIRREYGYSVLTKAKETINMTASVKDSGLSLATADSPPLNFGEWLNLAVSCLGDNQSLRSIHLWHLTIT
jgi:hypothetical protein